MARQWRTPHKNLDGTVDNSRQARALSATDKSGREYASFKFKNSDTYRVVVVPAVSSYLAGEGVHPRLGTFQKLHGSGTSFRFAPVASVLPAVQLELSSPARGAERLSRTPRNFVELGMLPAERPEFTAFQKSLQSNSKSSCQNFCHPPLRQVQLVTPHPFRSRSRLSTFAPARPQSLNVQGSS